MGFVTMAMGSIISVFHLLADAYAARHRRRSRSATVSQTVRVPDRILKEETSAKSILEKEYQKMETAKELVVAYLQSKYGSVHNPQFTSVGRPIYSDKDEVITEGLFYDHQGGQHYFKIKVVDGKAIEVRTT